MAEESLHDRLDSLKQDDRLSRALAAVSTLLGLTGGLSFLVEMTDASHWGILIAGVFLFGAGIAVAVWLIYPSKIESPDTERLDFDASGERVYAYADQEERFRAVLRAAQPSARRTGALPPVIVLFGQSGVGKSSFLLRCFRESPTRATFLDLREGTLHLAEKLAGVLSGRNGAGGVEGASPTVPAVGGMLGFRAWLEQSTSSEAVTRRLAEQTLIIDQFEQVIVNSTAMTNAGHLFHFLAPHCRGIIVSVRSDVLGEAMDGLQKLLRDPLDMFHSVRIFELLPVPGNSDRLKELFEHIADDIFNGGSPPDEDLLEAVTEGLRVTVGEKYRLPVYIRLVLYALRESETVHLADFDRRFKRNVRGLIDGLFDGILKGTKDKDLALKALLSLVSETGVAEQFVPSDVRFISATSPDDEKRLQGVLDDLRKSNTISVVGNGRCTITHELLGDLALHHAQNQLTASEREQIRARQRLTKQLLSRSGPRRMLELKLLDPVARVRFRSLEGLLALLGALLIVSRLFLWSPGGVSLRFDSGFAPAAVVCFGATFYYWLLFGNVGKPLRECFPVRGGRALWTVVLLCPLLGSIVCSIRPDLWLLAGAAISILTAMNQRLVSRWAETGEHKSGEIAFLFRRYSLMGLGVALVLLLVHYMASHLTDSEVARWASFASAGVFVVGLVWFSLTWWHGRNLRSLLARVDCDILVPRAEREARRAP